MHNKIKLIYKYIATFSCDLANSLPHLRWKEHLWIAGYAKTSGPERCPRMDYVLLPAAVVAGKTSWVARSGVSSFQRTDPNGRSSMRRTRTGSGPI